MSSHTKLPNRKSMRLRGYNYGSEGLYFITIITHKRSRFFGEVSDGVMGLSESGEIAKECWLSIPKHFPHVSLHAFVIMPDHIHGILEITENVTNDQDQMTEFKSPSKTIGSVIRGFKVGVTTWMRNFTTQVDIWHRGYYDHIIRSEADFFRIEEYIHNNPGNWHKK